MIPEALAEVNGLGIYYQDRKGRWIFMDNDLNIFPGAISTMSDRLETFALRLDKEPPELHWLYPRIATSNRRPMFKIKAEDELSGLDDRTINLEVDGQFVLLGYDPENDRLMGTPEEPLSVGEHKTVITVRDFCGNETRLEHSFRITNP